MGQSAVVEVNESLFDSAHDALVFAFNFSGQCYDRPMMNRLGAPTFGTGKGLAGLDGAAQAGMIRAEVQSLGSLAEAILIARLAPRSTPCICRSSCCSGKKPNQEWMNAIAYLSDHVRRTALFGCTSNGILRRAYVARYFTRKEDRISIDTLAEKHNINRHTVSAHSSKVATLFAGSTENKAPVPGLEYLAQNYIEERLREIGMVG